MSSACERACGAFISSRLCALGMRRIEVEGTIMHLMRWRTYSLQGSVD